MTLAAWWLRVRLRGKKYGGGENNAYFDTISLLLEAATPAPGDSVPK